MKLTAGPARSLTALLTMSSLGLLPANSLANDSDQDDQRPVTNLDRVNALRPEGGGMGMATGIGGGSTGRWDVLTPAPSLGRTDAAQETDIRDPCGNDSQPGTQGAGNPVVLYTGNKIEIETDFTSAGEMGLYLQRSYNHHWSATGLFGHHWLSNFDYSLILSDGDDLAWLQRPDGRRLKFLRDLSSGRWYDDRAQPVAYIERHADGSFTVHNEERGTERYDPQGYITQRKNEQGVAWNFTYINRYLQKVTHSSGRSVQFIWTNGQLTQVIDPAGNSVRYSYTPNVFAGPRARLASATLPGAPATTISYHYEDGRYPGGLTGKSFNGIRYSTFAYDDQRRTIRTEHAGGVERNEFSYNVLSSEQVTPPPPPLRPGAEIGNPDTGWCEYDARAGYVCYEAHVPSSGRSASTVGAASINLTKTRAIKMSVTHTNPLGRRTTYVYENGKLISVAGDQSPRCSASYKELTYDSNGLPDILSDFQGTLTDYDYDAQGREVRKVQAAGTPLARTIETTWNAQHRIVSEKIVGVRQSDYKYDTRGNITSIIGRNLTQYGVPNQKHATNYVHSYHGNGLKASLKVDGPLAQDDVTYRYSTQGDLLSVTNALGHVTTYGDYNSFGMPGRVTNANGHVTEVSYDNRARLISRRSMMGNAWAATTFAYDGAGNLASITQPDGVTVRYDYDAAKRLQTQVKPQGDGTYAWTRYTYDAASNITRTEVLHNDYAADTAVVGYVDQVAHDAQWNWSVRGWACTTGSNTPIQVEVFSEGGTLLGATTANLASSAAVASACQATGSAYSFQVPISLAHRQQFGGQKILVHGLSPRGSAYHRAIGNSGALAIPMAQVTGQITGVSKDQNWNYFVEGWACSIGSAGSIPVHIYVGGAAGSGVYALTGNANLASDSAISKSCQSNGKHRFRIPLDYGVRQAHGGKSIHVHGISPSGGPNLVIGGSGTQSIPHYIKSVKIYYGADKPNIVNGESTLLRGTAENTGNVVWQTDNYVLWGETQQVNQRISLTSPIYPGQSFYFDRHIAPPNHNNFTRVVSYIAIMANDAGAWGTQGHTVVYIGPYYEQPSCDFGQDCEEVISFVRKSTLQEGAP